MSGTIEFELASKEDRELIARIVDRASSLYSREFGTPYSKDVHIFRQMDFCTVQVSGDCKLNLKKLLQASDFDFLHDFLGVVQNLNRKSGKLDNCFTPRCTVASNQELEVAQCQ